MKTERRGIEVSEVKFGPYVVAGDKSELYARLSECVLISEMIKYKRKDRTRRVDRRLRVE